MIAMRNDRKHLFRKGKASHAWFEGFQRRHPKLTIVLYRHLLTTELRICANRETIDDFLANLDLCMDD